MKALPQCSHAHNSSISWYIKPVIVDSAKKKGSQALPSKRALNEFTLCTSQVFHTEMPILSIPYMHSLFTISHRWNMTSPLKTWYMSSASPSSTQAIESTKTLFSFHPLLKASVVTALVH
jgi:hypothetical protein